MESVDVVNKKKRKRTPTENELVSLFYFEQIDETQEYKCKKCPNVVRTKKPGSGFTNLFTHVTDHHKNYKIEMSSPQNTLEHFLLPAKEQNIYGWLDWIVGEGLPFSTVEKALTRKYTTLEPICNETFMEYMNKLTRQVEGLIKKTLPDKFCLLFDGWTLEGQSTQFIGIYATYINEQDEAEKVLLAFQPLLDESDFSAQSHKDLIDIIITSFGKDFSNVVCLIGDNCPVNICTAKLCIVPFIGIFQI